MICARPHLTELERRAAGGVAAAGAGVECDRDDNAEPLEITAAELETKKTLQDVLDYLKEKGERDYPPPQKLTLLEKKENHNMPAAGKYDLTNRRNAENACRQRGRTSVRRRGLQQVAEMLAAQAAAAAG